MSQQKPTSIPELKIERGWSFCFKKALIVASWLVRWMCLHSLQLQPLEQLEKKTPKGFLLNLTGVRSHSYAEVPSYSQGASKAF